MSQLPVHDLRAAVADAFCPRRPQRRLVLAAPTGSGKSTQLPQFLVDDHLVDGQVLVLQPRRLAAKMLARRVAAERRGRVGGEIGFQTRFERALGPATRVRFATDGILPRLFLADPELHGIGAVIFDEFHERSLAGDLGLCLALRLQRTRPDLAVCVMSATLDTERLAAALAPCRTVASEGRAHPVEITYLPHQTTDPLWTRAAAAVRDLIRDGAQGDVLVFMPGQFEITRTIEACRKAALGEPVALLPLYGNLAPDRQDAVMAPAPRRKVVVATNIAETSLTIPGVRHVIDAGQARVQRYDPGRGLNALVLDAISRNSAAQRAGRAGRESPGTCRRLWTERQHQGRPQVETPEILRVDLADAVLQLAVMGLGDIRRLPWMDPPPEPAVTAARHLLELLGAVDDGGQVTELGRRLAALPLHPRLGRLLVEADLRDCTADAIRIAALMSERPIVIGGKAGAKAFRARFENCPASGAPADCSLQSDFFAMFEALELARRANFSVPPCRAAGLNAGACRQVCRAVDHFVGIARGHGLTPTARGGRPADLLQSMLLAFPDRLARRRDKGSVICCLRDGRRGELAPAATVRDAELFVAGEIQESTRAGQGSRVLLSSTSTVREEWLDQLFPNHWEFTEETVWNEPRRAVEEVRRTVCLGVVLNEIRGGDPDPTLAAELLAREIRRRQLPLPGWGKEVKAWIERVRCAAEWFPEHGLITYTDAELDVALAELCAGERTYRNVRTKPALPFVRGLLSWADQQLVQRVAPEAVRLAGGRRLRLRYRAGQPPKGSARIQDLYDTRETPVIGDGRIKVLIEILGPNMRAVQITDDLAGFWRDLYPKVRRELARRYPKHEWR